MPGPVSDALPSLPTRIRQSAHKFPYCEKELLQIAADLENITPNNVREMLAVYIKSRRRINELTNCSIL